MKFQVRYATPMGSMTDEEVEADYFFDNSGNVAFANRGNPPAPKYVNVAMFSKQYLIRVKEIFDAPPEAPAEAPPEGETE